MKSIFSAIKVKEINNRLEEQEKNPPPELEENIKLRQPNRQVTVDNLDLMHSSDSDDDATGKS